MSASCSASLFRLAARRAATSSLPRASAASSSSSTSSSISRSLRHISSTSTLLDSPRKPSISGIASLRKSAPGTSMLKAREAISSTWNEATGVEDLDAALRWLEEDRQKSGAKKADKVAGREAKEGLVGICVLSDGLPAGAGVASAGPTSGLPQAGMVELNCETDFVARNELFGALLRDLAHTASFFPIYAGLSTSGAPGEAQPQLQDLDLEAFLAFPLLPSDPASSISSTTEAAAPKTVQDAIVDAVARLGERIHLARATCVLPPPLTSPSPDAPRRSSLPVQIRSAVSSFAHGAPSAAPALTDAAKRPGFSLSTGRVASLLLTRFSTPTEASSSSALTTESGQAAARGLLRSLARQTAGFPTLSIDAASAAPEAEEGSALLDQPFAMLLSSSGLDASSLSGSKVSEVLDKWAAEHLGGAAQNGKTEVVEMRRWEVGGSKTA